MNLVGRSFLKLEDFNPGDLRYLLDLAKHFKFGTQKILRNLNLLQRKRPYKVDQHLNGITINK